MAGAPAGPPSDNLFLSGLPEGFDEASLRTIIGAYGTISQCKVMTAQPGRKAAAMVRFATVEEAQWIVENLNGNIPQGLTDAVEVKFAMSKDQNKGGDKGGDKGGGKGWDSGKGYGGGPYDGGKGKDDGKGKGKCSIRTLVKGLSDAGALPGGPPQGSDEHTLFVAGLPNDTTDIDLYKIFAPFGPVKGVKAMLDRDTGVCTGTGFVNFMDPNATGMSIQTLNGTMMPDSTWLTVKIKTNKGAGKDGGKGKDWGKDAGKGW